jgi:glycogen synthase
LRILIVGNLYPPHSLGGYEILCQQIAEGFAAMGHQMQVLTSDWVAPGLGAVTEPGEGGILVERSLKLMTNFPNPPGRNPLIELRTAAHNYRVTKEAIAKFKPECIVIFSQLRLSLGSAHAAEDFGCPVLYSWNDEHPVGYVPQPLELKSLGKVAKIKRLLRWIIDQTLLRNEQIGRLRLRHTSAISRCIVDRMADRGLHPKFPTRVIYQGIPLEKFPLRSDFELKSPVRILYTGQLHSYKGVHTLLDAIALLKERGLKVHCTIVGRGDEAYLERLRATAHSKQIDVDFQGYRPHQELPELYRSCDIFVFPSIWQEPFGLTHLEAMASGLPVVSTTHGGQGECLLDGENCLAFGPDNADQLCQQLERLIESSELRESLIRNGRKTVTEKLNLVNYVCELEQWVREAVCP